ncbi:PAS domain S-box protein [Kribbella qitaiheensis]|uniref:protein-glutamate O-methyltransferase n=1 Tax=Kribbella qitaiheensis TaxID=1544730 RepID=A0A7G6X2D6_9ACTN|nr:CheR family methyltransferase [Kribbella qitaiheensis]QNE20401.1 PAS domain S-box protein [Kribbella qitaiheensis]
MTTPATDEQADFEALLDYLRESRGFDFSGYKRTSLVRRIRHRMDQVGVGDYHEYLDLLQVDAAEFTALFNTILINVTSFFRDPAAWRVLRTDVIPALLTERSPGDPLRAWSTGCSSGQEAYTLAILLAEELGLDNYLKQVKIYATDIDDDALAQARQASYPEAELEGVPADLRAKYFELRDGRYVFHPELRRTVIFGRNDLVQDAPISRVDLLLCRNTLMYFNAETQQRMLNRFHFALVPRGVLFLGRAEMLLGRTRLFEPIDLKQRIFRRVANRRVAAGRTTPAPTEHERPTERLHEYAFAASPIAQLVIGTDDTLVMQSDQAAALFGLTRRDLGRPIRELEVSYQPLALRKYLDQVFAERKPVRISEVEFGRPGGVVHWFEVHLNPVTEGTDLLGVSVVFHDVSATRGLRMEIDRANRQLESTNAELQSTNEELETTNEELQSTVEELETTNEELQSTNEELETMNEELQSANDELQIINEALRERSTELNDANDFLESVLTAFTAGVIVVDLEMLVLAWNAAAQELWGVRSDEAEGRHLLNLDVGLPADVLRPLIRDALNEPEKASEARLEAVNRRGRAITVRLICSALRGPDGRQRGALLTMEPMDSQ